MAQQVIARVYGMDYNEWISPYNMTFPTQGVSFFPPSPPVKMGGIYMLSVVKVWITGSAPEYFTDKSYTQLATESNL